jgi:3-oxoacyl-[acyl-carrier protein] reductase
VFGPVAQRAGITVETMLASAATATLLKRLPTLEEVADAAAFLASDRAGAMTGAIANLSCGALVD